MRWDNEAGLEALLGCQGRVGFRHQQVLPWGYPFRKESAVDRGGLRGVGRGPLAIAEGIPLGYETLHADNHPHQFRIRGPGYFAADSSAYLSNEVDRLRLARLQLEEMPVQHGAIANLAQGIRHFAAKLILAWRQAVLIKLDGEEKIRDVRNENQRLGRGAPSP